MTVVPLSFPISSPTAMSSFGGSADARLEAAWLTYRDAWDGGRLCFLLISQTNRPGPSPQTPEAGQNQAGCCRTTMI